MSCPIHDRCTCYATSLHYTASLSTSTGSSQLPQASNIFVGYEWAAPMVPTSAAWYPLDSVILQPQTSHSAGNTSGTMPLHSSYYPEPHVYEREQKVASSHEQFAAQHPYPTPYIQGVSRMAIPSNHPEMLVQAHRNGMSSFGHYNYNGPSVINSDQSLSIDEPPPPYANNSLPVSPLSDVDVFSQSALLHPDRRLSGGPVTQSPLTPVPLRHSSLYHVLKQEESPASPTQGMLQSGESSIAHALELQEPQPRHVHPSCKPIIGNARARGSTIGASESALSATTSTQAHRPVSSVTPPCESEPAQDGSVVTPLQAHTLVPSPEVATQDYDTFPRLRKSSRLIQLQPPLPGSAKEDQSAASSPLSPVPSRPSSSMGAPAASAPDSKSALESAFTLPLLGRKRPVLRAKLACLFCRRRKIQCRPLPGDNLGNTCQQCAKRCRKCEYPEMTWRGRVAKKRSRDDLDESDEDEDGEYEEEPPPPPPPRSKSRRAA
ncbi:hypothetical protein BJV77DRAFT_1159546 [Russula vinacea]|nr:hypothetical protein BJV77DRAFT_1159546 [Russula vinacea]